MRRRAYLSALVFCATVAAGILAAMADGEGATASSPRGAARVAQLERQLGPGVRVGLHRKTGEVRFIGTAPGRPIPRPPGLGAGASPSVVARAFLDSYGREFGLPAGSKTLRVTRTANTPRGETAVRLQQAIGGVPVLAGELAVDVDSRGNVLSVLGEIEPDDTDTSAQIDPAEARQIAIASIAKGRRAGSAGLQTTTPQLAIYDSRLLGGPGLDVPLLVWRVEVTSPAGPTPRWLVLVDAHIGVVTEAIDLIEHAKDRRVCDAKNTDGTKEARYPCVAPYQREEVDGATGNADIDLAYDFAGDTYDFYSERFGRDSLDGAGLPLISTVRYCEPGFKCPYENAFWDGEQMVYGEGFAVADDVVGHELSHGFTQFTSNLFYWYQSGAINESMSDVFGEYMDLTNGVGTDTPAVRWLLGEDLPPSIGAIRNMKNPAEFNDPDRMTSSRYVADPDQLDNGGVHTNSGVNNKAAVLIADGETFNGQTVTGIGIDKAARVYYEAEATQLTSGSDYADLYNALQQACTNSISGPEGITVADCEEVTNAVNATEMNLQPLNGPAPEAPVCGAGDEPVDLFFDDLENPAGGKWTHSAISGTDGWYYPQNPNALSWLDATYATSGKTNFWGYDQPTTSDSVITQANAVTIPTGAVYLRFDHSYAFEDRTTPLRLYDGGLLEYSVDGGSTWQDAGPLFTHNGYNGTIEKKEGNPLAGRSAFVAESYGYISSRVDLSSLAGEDVRFRFRIGTDGFVDDYGWFVDDIHIYRCVEGEPPPDETAPETTIESGPSGPTNDSSPTFTFSSNEEPVTFECRFEPDPFAACSGPGDSHTPSEPLSDGTYAFEVRATDEAENTDPVPARREFTVDTEAPEAPTSLASDPASPANENEPLISGVAESGSTVRLYKGADCSGTVLDEGSAEDFESPGLQVSVLDNSTTTFRATTTDEAGNTSPCSEGLEYVEDSKAPETSLDLTPPDPDNDATPTFEFSADEPSSFECEIDGGGFSECTSPHTTAELTAQGSHTFKVAAIDAAGNLDETPATYTWQLDSEAPETTIESGPEGPTNDPTPAFEFSSNEAGSTFECNLDEAGFSSCTSPFEAGLLADGPHSFEVRAIDEAGNTDASPAKHEFTVDTKAPAVPTITATEPTSPANNNEPKVKGTVGSGSPTQIKLYKNGTCSGSPAVTDSVAQFTGSGITVSVSPDTTTAFTAKATDEATNDSSCSSAFEYVEDSEAPDTTIDEAPPSLTNVASAEFEFSGSDPGGSGVASFECRFDSTEAEDWELCTSPQPYSSLTDGSHTFEVRAIDEAGNTDASPAKHEFTVDTEAPDTTIDEAPLSLINVASAEFEFSGSDPGGSGVASFECRFDSSEAGDWELCTSPQPYSSLTDGSHTFEVRAIDEAGNTDASPAKHEFTVDTEAPAVPTITATEPASPANDNNPKVTGEAESGSTVKLYAAPNTSDCTEPNLAASGSSEDFESPGLQVSVLDNSTTTFRATATDEAGNSSPCSTDSILYVEDSEAPEPPTITATEPASPANDNNPTVTGEAEAGSTVRLYSGPDCGGSVLDEGSVAEFESTGLTTSVADNSTTTFRATAESGAGNTSACSAGFEYVEDSEAPDTTIDEAPLSLINVASAEFEFSGSDPGGSGVASFECRFDSTEAEDWELCTSPQPYSSLTDGSHTFEVRAIDEAGNTDASPAKHEFTVDTKAPAVPTITATEPTSPANNNEPKVKGTVGSGSPTQIKLYKNGTCSGSPAVTDSVAQFTGSGITVSVSPDTTTAFTAKATDEATNDSSCSSAFEYVEDSTPPTNPTLESTSHEVEVPSNDTTVDVSFSGATDTLSGLDGFSYEWDTSPTTTPDTTKEAEESATEATSPTLADGSHYFHLRTRDNAGNWSSTVHLGPFTIDTEAPGLIPPLEPTLPVPDVLPLDEIPPGAMLFGSRSQVAGGAIVVRVRCGEPCTVVVRGRVVIWHRVRGRKSARAAARQRVRIGLRRVARTLTAGRTVTLKQRPRTKKAARRLRRLVRSGWKARAAIRARYVDGAGNVTTRRTTVWLRLPR